MRPRSFVLLAETTTTDELGDIAEGAHGIMSAGGFVDMAGIVGQAARDLLDAEHAETAELVPDGMSADALADVLLGAVDHVDHRATETIYYGADVPDVGPDVPYVRAVVIRTS